MILYVLEVLLFAVWYDYACVSADNRKKSMRETLQPVNLLAIAMIATGMCFFVNFQLPIVSMVLPDKVVMDFENMMDSIGYGIKLIPTLITLFLAPLAEEFMFRGIMFFYLQRIFEGRLGKRKTFWLANFIQAVIFGIYHMNLIQGTYAFVVGLVLGYLMFHFGSIVAPILAHMLHNFLSTFVWQVVAASMPDSNGAYAIGAGLSLCVVVLGTMLCMLNSDKIGNE